ncbi:uncharacterized protein LOC112054170 [Bicyclus anynana]|uniref:Uncharacterized protein LOC112054170 n=1 Tax=Bicyclus anynana TaxID=110368 RepID=A0A6J1NWM7_BICAN|nr:uncharacterized protein LOC112054170 [Bicyclus anynana]
MSHSRNVNKLTDKSILDVEPTNEYVNKVTVSKKPSLSEEGTSGLCVGQKSFISIHSTDQLCQVTDTENPANLDECNVEVLSLNQVFPSTSDESISNDDEPAVRKKKQAKKTQKAQQETSKSSYVPTNSKSSTSPGWQKDCTEVPGSVHSDFDLPKNTMHVIGSNPGEPKMSYKDSPKKMTKTMKKFLRNIDKQKNDQSKNGEKAISKLTTMRGILKDGGCGPECTGDSSAQDGEDFNTDDTLPTYEYGAQANYAKQIPDKNVSFNTEVLIIHFTGDLCVGQSIETLSKEKDQQARNSELRKTFLTKYNELWPSEK